MTLTIELSPMEEARLADIARESGLEPAAFVKKLVTECLPPNDPVAHVKALLALWQAEDALPAQPPILTHPGETPTEALFRTWDEEDAALTLAEQQSREALWEDFQSGINETRLATGMRTLF